MSRPAQVRCAIYTRKSTEEGLDQEFNSLDAQHEASAAYIASQRHEGWRLLADRYDDGGVSGGTMDRPGLQRLLADIDRGRVDMVVVYKIDRLTRSLADFARLVERLDRAGCSFVSVTQAFNTPTSMGRLTLNVLLSFAQFEREVTAERIRDKIAASKRKGLWMGGLAPLGYDPDPDPQVRTLVVNEGEAASVRTLFELYDRHGCLRAGTYEAAERGIRSKRRLFASGRTRGGGTLFRGQVHFLLTNPVYIGPIGHRQQSYPGQHASVVDDALWKRVQAKLRATSARPRGRAGRAASDAHAPGSSPLAGKVRDEAGDRLTPTHTQRHGRRHRYYVSNRLVSGKASTDAAAWRLPAPAFEDAVAQVIARQIAAEAERHALVIDPEAATAGSVRSRAIAFCRRLRRGKAGLLHDLVASGRLSPGSIDCDLSRPRLPPCSRSMPAPSSHLSPSLPPSGCAAAASRPAS